MKQREAYLAEIKKMQTSLEQEAKELEQQQSVLAQDVFEGKVQEFRRKQLQAKQTEAAPLVDDATWAAHYADAPIDVPDLTRPEKSPEMGSTVWRPMTSTT